MKDVNTISLVMQIRKDNFTGLCNHYDIIINCINHINGKIYSYYCLIDIGIISMG